MDPAHVAGIFACGLPAAPPAPHAVPAERVQDHPGGGVHGGAGDPRPAPDVRDPESQQGKGLIPPLLPC